MKEEEFKPYWGVINFNPGYGANPTSWIDSKEKEKEVK